MMLLLIGIATGIATFIGGSLALHLRDRLHLILGFTAGAIIAVAFFDLLPEALSLGVKIYSPLAITSVLAAGFLLYMLLDRALLGAQLGTRGHVGAASLTFHSFLDGLAIGLAFQVSSAVGMVVTIAVLVHDFSDGINTVNLSMIGGGSPATARRWLIADAFAPLVGIGVTLLVAVPQQWLALILALFSGFFLYIGASELLPESYHNHPRLWTSVATVLGMLVLYIAIRIAG